MKYTFVIISIALLVFSCKTEPKQKVEFKAEIKEDTKVKDSTLIEFADLPIRIDSTEYLIHIKGFYKKRNKRSEYRSYDKDYYGGNYDVAYYDKNSITGNISNVKFQKINTTQLFPLTSKKIRINSITYLKQVFINSGKQFLIYDVIDIDTNNDKILNNLDISSLYLSNINGSSFKKISTKYFNLLDWKVIETNNAIYFRSIEDINKDGKFEKEDMIHYQFVNLNDKDWNVKSYNPL